MKEHLIMSDPLDAIFKPKTIAVIGASTRRGTLGYKLMHNLITFGFEGIIYPVNQKSSHVHSIKSYKIFPNPLTWRLSWFPKSMCWLWRMNAAKRA
jgi:predicted CoA-binding protein